MTSHVPSNVQYYRYIIIAIRCVFGMDGRSFFSKVNNRNLTWFAVVEGINLRHQQLIPWQEKGEEKDFSEEKEWN